MIDSAEHIRSWIPMGSGLRSRTPKLNETSAKSAEHTRGRLSEVREEARIHLARSRITRSLRELRSSGGSMDLGSCVHTSKEREISKKVV